MGIVSDDKRDIIYWYLQYLSDSMSSSSDSLPSLHIDQRLTTRMVVAGFCQPAVSFVKLKLCWIILCCTLIIYCFVCEAFSPTMWVVLSCIYDHPEVDRRSNHRYGIYDHSGALGCDFTCLSFLGDAIHRHSIDTPPGRRNAPPFFEVPVYSHESLGRWQCCSGARVDVTSGNLTVWYWKSLIFNSIRR